MISDKAKLAIGGEKPLRFVQIAVATSGDSQSMETELYGLTADGQVYMHMWGRETLKEPREAVNAKGIPYKNTHGPTFTWWQPLRMSNQKGADFEHPATPKEFL